MRSHPKLSVLQRGLQSLLPLLLLAPAVASAESTGGEAERAPVEELKLELISNTVKVPWGMAVLNDGDLLVTERDGKLYRISSSGDSSLVTGVPAVYVKGQGGLLDVVVHPDEPWVYFSYAKAMRGGGHTAIARAKLQGNSLSEWTDLYVGEGATTKGQHFGSRLALHDGYLFFTIGDRGARDRNPQNLARDGGKVYRLHDDGRVPDDNPFASAKSAKKAVWSFGHRNPQGLVFEPESAQLWLHEHGPRGGDELNLLTAGANYGWPLVTYGVNYSGTRITDKTSMDGMTAPAWHWTPSIAPSGMAVVKADSYPALGDGLLIGSLKFGELHFSPRASGDEATSMQVVMEGLGRVRSLVTGPDGTVYVGVTGDGVFRLAQ